MKITIQSEQVFSLMTGFWTKWVAKCGKYKGEGRTEYQALRSLKKVINDELEKKSKIKNK